MRASFKDFGLSPAPIPIPADAAFMPSSPGLAAPTAQPVDMSALDRRLLLAAGDAALDAIAHDIVASAASTGRARFAITPDALGRVDVDVAQAASGIIVHFATSSRAATDALVTAQPLLAESIGTHGIRLVEVQVSTGGPGADRQTGGQWSGQRSPSPASPSIEAAEPSPHATPSTPSRARHPGRFA